MTNNEGQPSPPDGTGTHTDRVNDQHQHQHQQYYSYEDEQSQEDNGNGIDNGNDNDDDNLTEINISTSLSRDEELQTSMCNVNANVNGKNNIPIRRRDKDDSSLSLSMSMTTGNGTGTGTGAANAGDEEDESKLHKRKRQRTCPCTLSIPTSTSTCLHSKPTSRMRKITQNPILQKISSLSLSILLILLLKKAMKPSILQNFLIWMEHHPFQGLAAYLILYPLHMLLILPGTPLVMGAGFVFKLQYGWIIGVTFCSIITLLGSLIGSIWCFLLGRYCFRTSVRRWSKKYPLFEPIDLAVSKRGFRIMAMIYLTPAVPLGPISYMMGTTSMEILDFAKAKIAALPMTALYVYLGAATGTLMTQDDLDGSGSGGLNHGGTDGNVNGKGTMHKTNMEEMALSPKFIAIGIVFSIGIIAVISVKMKKELQKILDEQKGKSKQDVNDIEMQPQTVRTVTDGQTSTSTSTSTSTRKRTKKKKVKSAASIKSMGTGSVDNDLRTRLVD